MPPQESKPEATLGSSDPTKLETGGSACAKPGEPISITKQQAIIASMVTGCDINQLGFNNPVIDGITSPAANRPQQKTAAAKDHSQPLDPLKPLAVPLDGYLSFSAFDSKAAKPLEPVNQAYVEEGRSKIVRDKNGRLSFQQGILQFSDRQDLQNFQNWLNAKIPPDGKPETDDKRTALILEIAMADAARTSSNPSQQTECAYETLNAMRHSMEELMPEKGYHLDSGLANAEHFLETAHRVAGRPFDGNATDLAGQVFRGKWSAGYWNLVSAGYNDMKRIGLISGSNPTHQHEWEVRGIEYGEKIYDATARLAKPES